MKNFTKLVIGTAFVAVAGCTSPQPEGYREAEAGVDSFVRVVTAAQLISSECQRYSFDDQAGDRFSVQTAETMQEQGLSPIYLNRAIAAAKTPQNVYSHALAYARERSINLNDKASICSAGDYEKANNTAIGSLLRRR